MDIKQIEYIVQIAEDNNITRAAEKLFISQSALNQQLLKLEKELGTPLFYRDRANWRLTPAGEVYISNAKEVLRIKKDTYARIHDLMEIKQGHLSIGFTTTRGIEMFTALYPRFHESHPLIEVEPVESTTRKLQELIADDKLDIGFMTLSENEKTKDEYMTLKNEEFYLFLPAGHPLCEQAGPGIWGDGMATISPALLSELPFVRHRDDSTMSTIFNRVFEGVDFAPRILFKTMNNNAIVKMVQTAGCAAILPEYYAKPNPPGVKLFHLPSRPVWQVAVSWRRGSYLTQPAREFIQMVQGYWC